MNEPEFGGRLVQHMRYFTAVALVAALTACSPLPPAPEAARLPPGTFAGGGADQDIPAVEYAKYAFAVPARTKDNPIAGIQAVVALEYIAGEFNAPLRWAQVGALTKTDLLRGQKAARAVIGISPDAPAQLVIDRLIAARDALNRGNEAAASRELDDPAFSKGGDATIKILANLPYISMANISTMHAAGQIYGPDSGDPLYRD